MSSDVELNAEQLVYGVALELGLSEREQQRLDVGGISARAVVGIRIAVQADAGRRIGGEAYLLPDPNVIDLRDALRRLGERIVGRRPAS